MLSASRKGPAFKPQLRVCYLCGQQFGSASIGIHIPQCYAKKLSQWEIADPATRGKRPKHPDTVNWKGEGMSRDKLNDEQFHEFTSNLVPCQRCGRKFLPDRLVVHLRGCKGDGGRPGASRGASSSNNGAAGGSSGESLGNTQSSMQRSGQSTQGFQSPKKSPSRPPSRAPGYKPQLPICYLCGQQFGSTSIDIHIPQCYAKKLAQWEVADVNTRGKPPKHPDTVNWKTEGKNVEEHNDAQFAEFVNNLESCPNCGRRFLADRLVVHLRSCKPGATSRPPPQKPTLNSPEPRGPFARPSIENGGPRSTNQEQKNSGTAKRDTKNGDGVTKDVSNLNPKVKRLPKDGKQSWDGVACPHCGVVEYDVSARFCRDCGTSLVSKKLPDPCKQCGEQIPEGSRFCGTCGLPVHGATATERKEGAENANMPTIRVVTCPACKAICDADGNFCDNCGAVLGNAEPSPAPEETKEVMFCKNCHETVFELSAKFCEDCGGILERVPANVHNSSPGEGMSPLPFFGLKSDAAKKATDAVSPLGDDSSTSAEFLPSPKSEKTNGDRGRPSAQGVPPRNSGGPTYRQPHPPPPTSKKPTASDVREVFEDEVVDVGDRLPCGNCGRKFAPDALERHERVCAKQKPRREFNMREARLAGTGAERVAKSSRSNSRTAAGAPKRDWRAESEAFRRSMQEARMVDKVLKAGGNARDLPPPTYSENSHYIPCPHCGRKFAPDVAERHIPRCSTTLNKPKPPPKRR